MTVVMPINPTLPTLKLSQAFTWLGTSDGQGWGASLVLHAAALFTLSQWGHVLVEPAKLAGRHEVVTLWLRPAEPQPSSLASAELTLKREIQLESESAEFDDPTEEPRLPIPSQAAVDVPVEVTPSGATVQRRSYVWEPSELPQTRAAKEAEVGPLEPVVLPSDFDPPEAARRRSESEPAASNPIPPRSAPSPSLSHRAAAAVSAALPEPGGNDNTIKPRAVRTRPPIYPNVGRWLPGAVRLRLKLSAAGTVESVTILERSGHSVLDAAAYGAVQDWLFEPARRNGRAVPYELTVKINFTP